MGLNRPAVEPAQAGLNTRYAPTNGKTAFGLQLERTDEVKDDTIIGSAVKGSQVGKARMAIDEAARAAKESADIESLFAAYQSAVEDRAESEDALFRVSTLLAKKPSDLQAESPIRAIRDVALAAIELARDVAMGTRG